MAILGAHQSIAGGYHRAVERAARCGCDCLQLFTKNNNQWAAKPITADEVRRFRDALDTLGITHPLAHDAYLINLASPDPRLWRKSVDAFVEELHRAEALGIPYVVTHPGAYTSGDEQAGLRTWPGLGRGPRPVPRPAGRLPAGNHRRPGDRRSAGGSSSLRPSSTASASPTGWASASTPATSSPPAIPCRPRRSIGRRWPAFDRLLGLDRIKAFHLNDSRRELGSRIDRHEHIGRGRLGLEPFRLLLADRRFRDVPMYLETPKGEEDGEDWDVANLQALRGLLTGGMGKRSLPVCRELRPGIPHG